MTPQSDPAANFETRRVNVLGVGVSAIDTTMALEAIDRWITDRSPHFVTITGVHGVMESQRDEEVRLIHNRAGLVTPDGMPLVWISRMTGHRHVRRVYGPDLMLAVCARSQERKYRHYLYGAAKGVPELLADRLRTRFPGLEIAGTHSPPYRPLTPEEDAVLVEEIDRAQPDIVWVGLSTPKQERWMAAHVGRLEAPVLIGVGAAFDFLAGLKKQAPRWIQRSGLEWFYRLLSEPGRLWKRYLRSNPLFVASILLQATGLRRYSLEEGSPDSFERQAELPSG